MHDGIISLWSEWQRAILSTVIEYVKSGGTFTFHLWQTMYQRLDAVSDRRCPKCKGETTFLDYISHLNEDDRHYLIQCAACGVLGEMPDGVELVVHSPEEPHVAGSAFTVNVEIGSTRSADIVGYVSLLRECWFRRHPDIGEPVSIFLPRGARETIRLSVAVTSELAPGVYPLTIIGVLNGWLLQVRLHVTTDAEKRGS